MHLVVLAMLVGVVASENINVMFNACSGGSGGGCDTSRFVRYVEADFPPYDDYDMTNHKLAGFNHELFQLICATEAFKGTQCYEVRDKWSNVWTPEEYPGEGLLDGWYDMAFAFVNNLRAASFDYSDYVTKRQKNGFLVQKTTTLTTFPDKGEGLSILVVCGWGNIPLVRAEYPLATVLERRGECAENTDDLLKKLKAATDPDKTVGFMEKAEIVALLAGGSHPDFKQLGDDVAPMKEGHTDAIAFMFNRKGACKRDLFNRALKELKDNSKFKTLCDKHQAVTCYV
eukprot:Sspe_Gene.64337::Locus_37896_Transcript_1_1_Confidence_1.000_Length_983::g.64337::m.64337